MGTAISRLFAIISKPYRRPDGYRKRGKRSIFSIQKFHYRENVKTPWREMVKSAQVPPNYRFSYTAEVMGDENKLYRPI